MKKILLLSVLSLGLFAASAQDKTVFGVRGALNVNTLVSPPNAASSNGSHGNLYGFAGGLFAEIPFAANFAFQPELDYSMKGTQGNGTINNQNFTVKENLNYITLPVLFKYIPSGLKGLNVFVGPEIGYLLSAKQKITISNMDTTMDVKNQIKPFDFGVDVGVGYDFIPNLGVDFRYGFGLMNILKSSSSNGNSLKNQTFQIGIRFLFGKKD